MSILDNIEDKWGIPSTAMKIGAIAVLGVFIITMLTGFHYNGSGESAIVFNGATTEYETKGEGWYYAMPVINKVTKYDVKDRITTLSATAASYDLQQVETTVTVRYYPDGTDLQSIHQTIGKNYKNKVVLPAVKESVKACTAQFTYTEMIQKRDAVKECVFDNVTVRLNSESIITSTVDIVDFSPPAELTKAITAKEAARQEAQRQENLLAAEEAKAQQKIAAATGEAEAARILAEQLTRSGGDSYLYLEFLKVSNGQLPGTFVGSEADLMFGLN